MASLFWQGFARVQLLRDGELPLHNELRRYGVEADLPLRFHLLSSPCFVDGPFIVK